MLFFEASMPVKFAPSLEIGSDSNPPPQPISKIFKFFKGLLLLLILKCETIFSRSSCAAMKQSGAFDEETVQRVRSPGSETFNTFIPFDFGLLGYNHYHL